MTADDLSLLVEWFNQPHVYEWWGVDAASDGLGGPGEQAATIAQVEAQYGDELRTGVTKHFVVLLDRRPIGLIQWYRLASYPKYAAEIEEPDAAAIDLLVGEVELLGRGLGVEIIRRFTTGIVLPDSGLGRVIGAPDVRNRRSIRAFEKAGFRWVRDAAVSGEPGPEHVMVFDRSDQVGE